jgi:uncharacterized protein (DUF488 family)
MNDADETLLLYTIGHSNREPDEFIQHLQQHQVTILVDVRSRPVSRYVPHFNKDNLEVFLPKQGIDYRYAGQYLGGQPDDPALYFDEERPDEEAAKRSDYRKKVRYTEVMNQDWYQRGIERLVDIIREAQALGGKAAIMCSEGDPRDCHRHHLIARSMLDPLKRVIDTSLQIQHILRDGSLEVPLDPEDFKPERPEQLRLF